MLLPTLAALQLTMLGAACRREPRGESAVTAPEIHADPQAKPRVEGPRPGDPARVTERATPREAVVEPIEPIEPAPFPPAPPLPPAAAAPRIMGTVAPVAAVPPVPPSAVAVTRPSPASPPSPAAPPRAEEAF